MKKKYTIISIYAEKAFDKHQQSLLIKNLSKTEIEEATFSMWQSYQQTSTTTHSTSVSTLTSKTLLKKISASVWYLEDMQHI